MEAEERAMAVRCLVAMIEIWMSDLWWVLRTLNSRPQSMIAEGAKERMILMAN